ncbi:hypothetical protein EYS14_01835 [Alteromonadaceae bacterium M269]|nr:hypothetical protein EYS14_01835 [Alteromonadaceae bacterium M269]
MNSEGKLFLGTSEKNVLDLFHSKCPRALIELKLGINALERGERLVVKLNNLHNNRDLISYIEVSAVTLIESEKDNETQTLTLLKQ